LNGLIILAFKLVWLGVVFEMLFCLIEFRKVAMDKGICGLTPSPLLEADRDPFGFAFWRFDF
jgi:hypothetical protein